MNWMRFPTVKFITDGGRNAVELTNTQNQPRSRVLEIIYVLFIYSSSYGIKIILSFRLSEYEKVCFLNFLRIQLIGLIAIFSIW